MRNLSQLVVGPAPHPGRVAAAAAGALLPLGVHTARRSTRASAAAARRDRASSIGLVNHAMERDPPRKAQIELPVQLRLRARWIRQIQQPSTTTHSTWDEDLDVIFRDASIFTVSSARCLRDRRLMRSPRMCTQPATSAPADRPETSTSQNLIAATNASLGRSVRSAFVMSATSAGSGECAEDGRKNVMPLFVDARSRLAAAEGAASQHVKSERRCDRATRISSLPIKFWEVEVSAIAGAAVGRLRDIRGRAHQAPDLEGSELN